MDKAAGFLAICHNQIGGSKFLILQSAAHHTWAPPKGLIESSDDNSLFVTAERELLEETGFKHDGERFTALSSPNYRIEYTMPDGRPKETTYFVLICCGEEVPTISSEHTGWRWVTLSEYCELQPRFQELHDIMRQADHFMSIWTSSPPANIVQQ